MYKKMSRNSQTYVATLHFHYYIIKLEAPAFKCCLYLLTIKHTSVFERYIFSPFRPMQGIICENVVL